jgi:hypothetical protein
MALDINRLRAVPMTDRALRDFLTGPDSGLTRVNEGHDFVDTFEIFDDEYCSMADIRKQLNEVSGDSGIGIGLHAWIQRNSLICADDGYNSEKEKAYRLSSMLKLFDAFASKRTTYHRRQTAQAVSDVFDYLSKFDENELKDLSYGILNRAPSKDSKALLSSLFEPDGVSAVSSSSCLYPMIFEEINKLESPLVWFQKNIPQRLLPYAYNLSGDLKIRSLMTKKTRGKAVELDLGM